MKTVKQIGIWMDHSTAFLLELKDDAILHSNIVSDFTHQDKELSLSKSEKLMHNKEQGFQSTYYKKIGDSIRNYQEVILFGPTDAKNELANLLKAEHFFDKIKIEVQDSDKMTEIEMDDFVKEYFK
jgi:stalled ribosome rescue protein Dom34